MEIMPSERQRDRERDIDIAKGIGIILVVWAHALGPYTEYIEYFHMPFFFFISGMLYREREESVKAYALHKAKGLLIPFWFWNLLLYPVFFVLYYWKQWSISTAAAEICEILLTVNKVPFLGATWFLPALFWVSCFSHLIITTFKRNKNKDLILLLVFAGACAFGLNVTLPYRISRTLICSLFYASGFVYKKHIRNRISSCVKNCIAPFLLIGFVLIASNTKAYLGGNEFSNKPVFVLGAYLAILFSLWLSKIIADLSFVENARFSVLTYLGRNSIDIVIWQFLAFRFAIIPQMIINDIGLNALTAFPVYDASGCWWFAYLVAGILGSLAWKYVLNHNVLTSKLRRIYVIR